jgi:hypothetical protein
MKDKLSRYAFKNNFSVVKKNTNNNGSPDLQVEEPQENEWAPDRFNKHGFKYQ